jgi:hypothetical protein
VWSQDSGGLARTDRASVRLSWRDVRGGGELEMSRRMHVARTLRNTMARCPFAVIKSHIGEEDETYAYS